jgi:DNA-directed RNA polymerase subunit RPC12/RpoP
MGMVVIATCECGVSETIPVGGGINNFRKLCLFPCLCEQCHKVVPANLLDKKKMECPNCNAPNPIPYDDPRLSGSAGGEMVFAYDLLKRIGRDPELTDGNYLCPKCGKMSLHFSKDELLWD